ncbi:MAG: glycosyl transferase family 1 [Chloroflexota bacterium]|nr:MAG: glycosyl transferase family 1 [Chloroflexota bacterium]
MRVLFITGEFPPMQGGVGDCTNELAQALTKRGAEVLVLTSVSPQAPLATPSAPVAVFYTMPHWGWSQRGALLKTIASLKPDIVHIQYQTGAFGQQPLINFLPRFIPPLGKKNGTGVAVTFHDLLPAYLFPKAGALRDWVTFQLARGADAVIATNEADYARLRDNARGQGKWLALIPIGSNITPSEIPPQISRDRLRERLGVSATETLLVYFGFLNPSKGAETLIQALYDLPRAKLLFLGGQTGASDATNVAYLERVKQEIRERGLEQRVLWTDFLPAAQVSAHFYASDICVLPYRDGASFRRGSIMAALAHGLPIVTTQPVAVAPSPELKTRAQKMDAARLPKLPALRDDDNVLFVPPDDPSAIIMAVTRIQTSPGLAAQLRSNARQTARAFSWDKLADEHLELYRKMSQGARG